MILATVNTPSPFHFRKFWQSNSRFNNLTCCAGRAISDHFGAFLYVNVHHMLSLPETAADDQTWGPPLLDSDGNETSLSLLLVWNILAIDNLKPKLSCCVGPCCISALSANSYSFSHVSPTAQLMLCMYGCVWFTQRSLCVLVCVVLAWQCHAKKGFILRG